MQLRLAAVAATLVGAAVLQGVAATAAQASTGSPWPRHGQAAYVLAGGTSRVSAGPHAVPIASVAKVMTAFLVLHAHPVAPGSNGFTMTVTAADVADWHRRQAEGQSTVPVRVGERLSERQALAALLLPSANNIAIMLARRVSGSVSRFVALMNRDARAFDMRHTTYTDPSGFDARTRSTALDQLRIALFAMQIRFFRVMVSRPNYRIPVAGWVHNTDTLLHHDGFDGIKTGSMSASGGCFVFRSVRLIGGRRVDLTGVVLGQPGSNLITAALDAARAMVDRIAPHAG